MNENQVRALLAEANALVTDRHFVYSRPKGHGDHGSVYIDKDACFWDPDILMDLAEGIAELFLDYNVQVIAGPADGAIGLAGFVGYQLADPHDPTDGCKACFLIKDDNSETGFSLRSAFKVAGKRVLVVEDIINSGDRARNTVATLRAAGAEVIGLSCLANQGIETAESLDVPEFKPLIISFEFSKMSEEDCLDHGLCADGVSIETKLGHGKDFLERLAVQRGLSRALTPDSSTSADNLAKQRLESDIAGG